VSAVFSSDLPQGGCEFLGKLWGFGRVRGAVDVFECERSLVLIADPAGGQGQSTFRDKEDFGPAVRSPDMAVYST
jgi:hypothetical protein